MNRLLTLKLNKETKKILVKFLKNDNGEEIYVSSMFPQVVKIDRDAKQVKIGKYVYQLVTEEEVN